MLGAAAMGAWVFVNSPPPLGLVGLIVAIGGGLSFLLFIKQALASGPAFMFDASGLFVGNRTIGWDDVHSVEMGKAGGFLGSGKGKQLLILTDGKRFRFNASSLALTPGGLAALRAELEGHRRAECGQGSDPAGSARPSNSTR